MNAKKLIYPIFALVVLAQLFVPCLMISSKADIALTGKELSSQLAGPVPRSRLQLECGKGERIMLSLMISRLPTAT